MLVSPIESLITLAFAIAVVLVFGAIFRKAGYSAWCGLLMLVPLINLIWLIYFAASLWPVHRELAFRRMDLDDSIPEDNKILIRAAAELEQHGRWDEAIRVYDAIASHPELPSAHYAQSCAVRLRDRIAPKDESN